jgi:hypothetical protein
MKAEVTEKEEKRKTIKLGAMFLVSMLALAGTGAAYALWFEDLYIYTDIYTGDVDVDWTIDGGYWIDQDKDISWISYYGIDGDTIWIQIEDAYPCIDYYFYFDVHCEGSIPVHFTPFAASGSLPDDCYEYEIFITSILHPDGTVTLYYDPVLIETIQLHEEDIAYGHLWIHFNNNLPQDDYFIFDLYSMAHQYNELDWGPENGD